MFDQNQLSNIYKQVTKRINSQIFTLSKLNLKAHLNSGLKLLLVGILILNSLLGMISTQIGGQNTIPNLKAQAVEDYGVLTTDIAQPTNTLIEGGLDSCYGKTFISSNIFSSKYCYKTEVDKMVAYSGCIDSNGQLICSKKQPLYYQLITVFCNKNPNETGECQLKNKGGTYTDCIKQGKNVNKPALCLGKREMTKQELEENTGNSSKNIQSINKGDKIELIDFQLRKVNEICDKNNKTCQFDGLSYNNCIFEEKIFRNTGIVEVATCDKTLQTNISKSKFGKEEGRNYETKSDNGITCEIYVTTTGGNDPVTGSTVDTNNGREVNNYACGKQNEKGEWVYSKEDTQKCTPINANDNKEGRFVVQLNCGNDVLNFAGGESIEAIFFDGDSTIILKDLSGKNITISSDDLKYQFCRNGFVIVKDMCKNAGVTKADFLSALSKFCQGLATGLPDAMGQAEVDKYADRQKAKCNGLGTNVKVASKKSDVKVDPTSKDAIAGLPQQALDAKSGSNPFGELLKYLFNIVLAIVYILLIFVKYLQMTILLIIASIMASLLNLNPTTSFLLNIGQPLWNIFANIANLGAVFIIIYLGAATMIGIMKSDEAIKNGTAVAIYVLISQFTYLGIAFVVGIVDGFSKLLVAVFAQGDIFNIFLAVFQSLQGMNAESGELLPGGKTASGALGVLGKAFTGTDVTGVVIGEALTLIMLMFLMMGFFKYFIMVIMRTTILMGLMITSPLWVLGYLAKDSLPSRFKAEIDKIPDLLTGAIIFNLAFVGLMILLGTFASQVIAGLGKITVASGGSGLLESVQVKGIGVAMIMGFILKITEILEGLIPPDLAAMGSAVKKWGDTTLKNIATGNTAELVKSVSGGAGKLITGGNETINNLTSAGLKVTGGQAIINKGIRMQAKASYEKSGTKLRSLQDQRKKLIDAGDIDGAQSLDQAIANVENDRKNAQTRYTDNKSFHERTEDLVNRGEVTGVDGRTIKHAFRAPGTVVGAAAGAIGGISVGRGLKVRDTAFGQGVSDFRDNVASATQSAGNAIGRTPVIGAIGRGIQSVGDPKIVDINQRGKVEAEVIAKNEQDQMRLEERNRREADLQLQLTEVQANLADPTIQPLQRDAYNAQRDSIQAQITDYQVGVTQMVVNPDGTTSSKTVVPTTASLSTGITNRTNTSGVDGNQVRVTIPSSPIRDNAEIARATTAGTTTAATYANTLATPLTTEERRQFDSIIAGFSAGGNTPTYGNGAAMDEIGQALAALRAMGKRQ